MLIYSLDKNNEPICEYIPICMLPGYYAVDDYKLYDPVYEAYPDYWNKTYILHYMFNQSENKYISIITTRGELNFDVSEFDST